MIIIIDTREIELIKYMQFYIETKPVYKEIVLKIEPLPIGDIIIHDGTKERIIIERKSISDLSASIKDGRYEEQSYRLMGLPIPNHNIIYLIEGDINKPNIFKGKIDKTMLYSAMFSLNHNKGFSVFRSFSMDETATIICNMANKLEKNDLAGKSPYYSCNIDLNKFNEKEFKEKESNDNFQNDVILSTDEKEEELKDSQQSATHTIQEPYCSVVKKIKKDNITPENIGEIVLCQIPGISSINAVAIMAEFKTLSNLIKRIQEDVLCLNNITYTSSKDQTRKISKTVIANVIKYLRAV